MLILPNQSGGVGPQGPQGPAGPNNVDNSTATTLTGVLFSDGGGFVNATTNLTANVNGELSANDGNHGTNLSDGDEALHSFDQNGNAVYLAYESGALYVQGITELDNGAIQTDGAGNVLMTTTGTANTPLVINGMPGQTARLQLWQDNGATKASVDYDGTVTAGALVVNPGTTSLDTGAITTDGSGTLHVGGDVHCGAANGFFVGTSPGASGTDNIGNAFSSGICTGVGTGTPWNSAGFVMGTGIGGTDPMGNTFSNGVLTLLGTGGSGVTGTYSFLAGDGVTVYTVTFAGGLVMSIS